MSESTTQLASTPKTDSLSQLVGKIAWSLSNESSAGDLAALRRVKSGDPTCLAFWKIAAAELEPSLPPAGLRREEAETRWRGILSAMAELEGLHEPQRSLGRALAEERYAKLRLERLLRAHGEALGDSVRTMAHFLGSKAAGFNQADLARLVLSDGRRDEDRARRKIARDYYRAQPRP